MLANDLAKAVADFGAAAVPVGRLRRELVRLAGRICRLCKGSEFLDRADSDAVRPCVEQGLAKSAVDSPGGQCCACSCPPPWNIVYHTVSFSCISKIIESCYFCLQSWQKPELRCWFGCPKDSSLAWRRSLNASAGL